MKFITFQYKSGSTLSNEWSELLDGPWPFPEDCYEAVFKMEADNPIYNKDEQE